MKNLLRLFLVSLYLSLVFSDSVAQNISLSIGSWREHTPFNKAIEVAEGRDGLIYCASQFGLFSFSKNSGEINIISRLHELSDLEIKTIRFDQASGVLMIAYLNSNIDIIFPDKNIVNLPDIKLKSIIGGKQINSITYVNGLAYLGCEFGIVVVDITRKEIKDTYYIGKDGSNVDVNGIAYDGTYLLAASDSGIYRAIYTDPNIFNFTAWTRDTSMTQPNANYTSATSLNGKFYVVKTHEDPDKDTVLVYQNNQWVPFIAEVTEGGYIDSYDNKLLYRNNIRVAALDETGNTIREVHIYMYPYAYIKRGFLDSGGIFWVADFSNGLISQRWDGYMQTICPNGPRSEAVWALAGSGGVLWVASGALEGDRPNYVEKNGISRFAENNWRTYDCTNDAIYQQLCASGSKSVVCVAMDPNDPDHAFVGNWGNGLLEYRKDGGVNNFDESNSSLHSVNGIPGYVIVGGVSYDDDGNLWAVAGGNTSGISVMQPNGAWQSFVIPEVALAQFGLYSLAVDDYGQKWFIARSGASTGEGLCVFKEDKLNNPNNVKYRRLTDQEGNGALPHIFVRSIAKDKDGSMWIGTDKGVGVIYNPGNVLTGGDFDAQKIILEQDGYNQYLLETEIVTAIAIDGANRKWFGTYSGGAFLMSPDGTHQIHNFNKDNSPLPSNTIQAIAIDDVTGEVFFGTDKGIISYRSDATEGGEQCSDYYVFPNPVRHEYHGPVAIRGLVENADVKIADVAGNVVFHTKANGGEAIWYGTNFSGERAQTGVYFVYVTNDDGSQTCVTKMLFAN